MSSGSSHSKSLSGGSLSHRKSLPHEYDSDDQQTKNNSLLSSASTASARSPFKKMSSILPHVNGYKRVDAGVERASRFRFGWKKFAIAAGVIIVLVWLFGPRERRDSVMDTIKAPTWGKPTRPPPSATRPPDEDLDSDEPLPPKTLPTSPHSPAEDPDLLKTVHCLRPYSPDVPLVQYALMIDAGSTGSRIHIYKFNNCGPSPSYEYEVFKMTKPGLSDYKGDPIGAAASLDTLLEEAVAVVPRELQSCTPVAVKATAGLRMLGVDESAAILEAVRVRLVEHYPFAVVEKDGVVIMDGSDEGVYAWITANYLLNTIRADSPYGVHSYAVLDLGGGSTQIVFEPDFSQDSAMEEGDHKYELQFGGKTRTLYQHSYLGYGLMVARSNVHRLVEFMTTFNVDPSANQTMPMSEISNPCLWKGSSRTVEIQATAPGEVNHNVTMAGNDVGSFEACNRIIELVMAKDAVCQVKPCSFNGVYQPSILETFANGNVLLLSYFYDRLAPFYPDETTPPSLSAHPGGADTTLRAELEGRPEWCLDLTFMHALLRLGYEFPVERGVRIEKQIEGTELGWCLGATIAIVGGKLTCRA
ncbi:hypothetical protein EW145_g5152 [Phellinidium pouzarii]|uniref:guanosine-diphosphatase n=1 Tax=Phellinidium pouzarii TaxID=167371 RepID=A0A4S4L0X6_9AGAM|nr:hypothetical protein EW145_g5152 [Phellinidium pouzarii]